MEPFQPKKTEDELVGEVLLEKAIKRKLNKPRKEVKFTWKGAADFLIGMSNTPLRNYQLKTLMDDTLPRVTDLAEGRDKPKEKDYIDFFEETEKALYGGVQDLGYSIGDLVTAARHISAASDVNGGLG